MILMPFDTETNAIPDWKVPSDSPHQPHMVQLAAVLVDTVTREISESIDVIIRPDGWEITEETIKLHGITMERAMDEGIPEPEALAMLMAMWQKADERTAFNTTFDNRIIRCAQKRYFPQTPEHEELMRSWKEDKHLYYCTMVGSKKIMGGKTPSLEEAIQHFFGREHENAHQAMADTLACMDLYFELRKDDPVVNRGKLPAAAMKVEVNNTSDEPLPFL